jgi:hypothetical protein
MERRNGGPASYTYLGRLKYYNHDRERQQPVHIAWQLLQWPIPEVVLSRMGLQLEAETGSKANSLLSGHDILREEAPPSGRDKGEPTRSFQAAKRRFPSDEETAILGHKGKLLVLERERQKLLAEGRPDLAALIRHISIIEGDGAGYEIASFFPDGRPKFIEVKTTCGPKTRTFG